MKIAIPVSDGLLCPHFGHCQQFAMVEANPETKTITGVTMLTPPAHEPGVLPQWLHQSGANVIIAGGMGQRAVELFTRAGVRVIIGAPVQKPEEVAMAYVNGSLATGDNACDSTGDCGKHGHH
jgi:predicted Fe-Mo cluster-binding NifX family protein